MNECWKWMCFILQFRMCRIFSVDDKITKKWIKTLLQQYDLFFNSILWKGSDVKWVGK